MLTVYVFPFDRGCVEMSADRTFPPSGFGHPSVAACDHDFLYTVGLMLGSPAVECHPPPILMVVLWPLVTLHHNLRSSALGSGVHLSRAREPFFSKGSLLAVVATPRLLTDSETYVVLFSFWELGGGP